MKLIGNNKIILNTATMCAALQMYLESQLIGPASFDVTDVSLYDSISKLFSVVTSERPSK